MEKELKSIILGAGKGTRMKSDLPKVLHEIFSKPLIGWVIDSLNEIENNSENIVVVGCGAELVENYLEKNFNNVKTVLQKEQLGTGHAIKQTVPFLKGFKGNVIITCGDTPLLRSETLKNFVKFHNENNADLTLMSAIFDDPFGYGRIIRNEKDGVDSIVEQKDATEEQKKIKEINTGVYCLNWEKMSQAFDELKNNNAQKEYYLTDIVKWANEKNLKVCGFVNEDSDEIYGINSRKNLAYAFNIMKNRKLDELMEEGVTIVDPTTTYISPDTTIEKDTIIYPSTYIEGKNEILKNCKIGPFARLRGGCRVEEGCKIGNFVELKNTKIAKKTNVCHLSYMGDAEIGNNVNIGAGTICANYNSITKVKSKTIIKDNASIGSNCVLVAPVEIGQGAFVGALSAITKNVEKDSLAIARNPQKEIKGWVAKKKNI